MPASTTTTPSLSLISSGQINISSDTDNGVIIGQVEGAMPYLTSYIDVDIMYVSILCLLTVPVDLDPNSFHVTTTTMQCGLLEKLHGLCIYTDYTIDESSRNWYIQFTIKDYGDYSKFVEFNFSDPHCAPGRGSISIPKSGIGDAK